MQPVAPIKKPKIERMSQKNWLSGTVTAFDDGRTPTDGLRASTNVELDQDGTIRPRPSLVLYGTQPPGSPLGEVFEFTKMVGGVNQQYLCCMCVVGGVAQVYYAKDGGAWTVASGKTYNTSANAHFCQIDNKVLTMNGVDTLSYLDIPTLAIIPFNALTTPGAPTLTLTNLTGTNFTYYYKISANSTVGETAASAETSVQVLTQRDLWTPQTGTSPQSIKLTWSAVTSAVSYNIYIGTVSGQEYLLQAGVNALSWTDDGSQVISTQTIAPVGDTTAGPKVTRGTVINGQVFLTGDADNPRYVRYGGYGAFCLDFSPFNGGGWVEVGRGTKQIPVQVMPFRDGHGTAQITVICKGTNGSGKRYLLSFTSTTVGDQVVVTPDLVEDNGQDGTDSPDGVVLYNDSLWYPSHDGFKTTGTKPELQNLLSTDTISETIIGDVKNLNSLNMNSCVGIAFERRLYWALPNGSTTNNEIWVLDLQRKGAWMKPWGIAATWLTLYNDNAGGIHLLVVSGGQIFELSDANATLDNGVGFPTNATSGIIKFSEDTLEWASVIDVTFILLRPEGTINFTIAGKTEDGDSLQQVGSSTFQSTSSVAGWGESGWGGVSGATGEANLYGWSDFSVIPTKFGDAQTQVTIEVDEELQWLTWSLNTTDGGVFYQLADVVIRYVDIGVKDLT